MSLNALQSTKYNDQGVFLNTRIYKKELIGNMHAAGIKASICNSYRCKLLFRLNESFSRYNWKLTALKFL